MALAFLVDGMLGSLNRWLRICGYETRYVNDAPDEELLDVARREGLVLLTRDKLLSRKASRRGIDYFLVEEGDEAQKLASVAFRFGLDLGVEKSRCARCGSGLRVADGGDVREAVPPRTYEVYNEFWTCDSCGKVYWRGSHWRNIVDTVDEARRLAGNASEVSEQDL